MSAEAAAETPIPIICVPPGRLGAIALGDMQRRWAEARGFDGQRGRLLALPDGEGAVMAWLFGLGAPEGRDPLITGLAAQGLEPGLYALAGEFDDPVLAALGFRLGAYRFEAYTAQREPVRLAPLAGTDPDGIDRQVAAATLARDLINTPANDLGPDAFAARILSLGRDLGMDATEIAGDALIEAGLPMIHAVGRGSAEAPRLIDLRWGRADTPRVTLVGKGVTFDTGGLDIKPAASMLLMKKDMGGAANVLGLMQQVVEARLDIRLRVLIPVVENAISGAAFRPGDVLRSRAGLSVEIGNTDAEGRLILADALSLADEEVPEILIDMATLTGAARQALGPELPPLYGTDRDLVEALVEAGAHWGDPLWPMPLWRPYERLLASKIADLTNAPAGGMAGSVTAALFLNRFVRKAGAWLHLDIFGWAPDPRPGQVFGGADQGIRAIYAVLEQRYGR